MRGEVELCDKCKLVHCQNSHLALALRASYKPHPFTLKDAGGNKWRFCSWACVASFARQTINDAHKSGEAI
jgi:hypothetical protein